MTALAAAQSVNDPQAVLTKVVTRAARLLGLSGAALARTVGVSEPTVTRLIRGDKTINPASKEGELGLLLVRVYRSLDALVGSDAGNRLAWMQSHNSALNGKPLQLVQSAQGMVAVLAYLDGLRAVA